MVCRQIYLPQIENLSVKLLQILWLLVYMVINPLFNTTNTVYVRIITETECWNITNYEDFSNYSCISHKHYNHSDSGFKSWQSKKGTLYACVIKTVLKYLQIANDYEIFTTDCNILCGKISLSLKQRKDFIK